MSEVTAAEGSRLSVLVADDHRLFRDGLRTLLRSMPDAELAGEAGDGEEAVQMVAALQPDVVVMDIRMPGVDGIDATRRIVRECPNVRVLIVTMLEDDGSVFAAMRAGARGYVLKGADHAEVVRSIRAVGNGEAIFSPAIAARMADYFASLQPAASDLFPDLSAREREILQLLVEGLKNAEIGRQLSLSPKTVRNNVSNILSKMQVADRTEAAVRALEAGLPSRALRDQRSRYAGGEPEERVQ
jgi:DNA-binding NarL/FixJ family response regulator